MMEKKLEKVLLYPSAYTLHTAYQSLIDFPPKGYSINYLHNLNSPFQKFKKNNLLKKIYRLIIALLNLNISKKILDKEVIPEDTDLILSMGSLYEGDKLWVVDILDNPYCLAGYNYSLFIKNKKKIEGILLSKNCKKIVCANESSVDLIRKNFSEELIKKTCLVRPAIRPSSIKPVLKNPNNFQILFMGSTTNPEDFYVKGGLETINTFEKLQKYFKNITLVIRCAVPKELLKRVKNNSRIELIEHRLSDEELASLYSKSDILLCPSHVYMLMSWLESMSYGLPIIALDTYAAKDYIKQDINGFLIPPSLKIPYTDPSYPVNIRSSNFINAIKKGDSVVIDALYEKLVILIKDKKLREAISDRNKLLVKKKFSVEKRNSLLKKVFDEALNI